MTRLAGDLTQWRQRTERAARKNRVEPRTTTVEELAYMPPFPFPYLGEYVPVGWRRLDEFTWLVDSTGFGYRGEPAYTLAEFKEVLAAHVVAHPGVGFAIADVGMFQCLVAAYERTQQEGGGP